MIRDIILDNCCFIYFPNSLIFTFNFKEVIVIKFLFQCNAPSLHFAELDV